MWIILNDAFFSIVQKDCARGEVLVRARRKGDIEKVFPGAKVARGEFNDYLYRAKVAKDEVKRAQALEVDRVTYPNFKDSVKDQTLHRAYARVWADMLAVEEPGRSFGSLFGRIDDDAEWRQKLGVVPQKRRRARKLTRRGQ